MLPSDHAATFAPPPYMRDPDEELQPDNSPHNCVNCPHLQPTKANPRKMECSVFTELRAGCQVRMLDDAKVRGVHRVDPGTLEILIRVMKAQVRRV